MSKDLVQRLNQQYDEFSLKAAVFGSLIGTLFLVCVGYIAALHSFNILAGVCLFAGVIGLIVATYARAAQELYSVN